MNYAFNAVLGEPVTEENAIFEFSIFQNLADKNPETITLDDFAEMVSGGEWMHQLENVREAKDKKTKTAAKKFLPAVTVSGIFKGGHNESDLVKHSGLICMDFDEFENPHLKGGIDMYRDMLKEDQFCKYVFKSASGTGLAAICRVDPERHLEAFDNLAEYFSRTFRLKADLPCSDKTRLRFVSWDNESEVKENARLFQRYSLAPKRNDKVIQEMIASAESLGDSRLDEIRSALEFVSPDSRDKWLTVGMALKMESNTQQAYDLFDAWSKGTRLDNYDPDTNWKQWGSFKTNVSGGRTMNTVFGMAKDSGWEYVEVIDQALIDSWVAQGEAMLNRKNSPFEPMPENKDESGRTIQSVAKAQLPIENDPKELLTSRLLCRGGGLLFSAPSGIGKSSFTMQAGLSWACGIPMLGIAPARPLRIILIQAENDDGDIAEARDGVERGLDLTPEQMELAHANFDYTTVDDLTGLDLCRHMNDIGEGYDLIILDPLFSYCGCSVSDQKDISQFLRNHINPVIKKLDVGLVIIHHTNKPPVGKEKSNWEGSDLSYLGSGSAELTNWARAVMGIRSIGDEKRYELIAPKRGRRLGWDDGATKKMIRHSEVGICWHEMSQDEIGEMEESRKDSSDGGKKKVDWREICEYAEGICKGKAWKRADLELHLGGMYGFSSTSYRQNVHRYLEGCEDLAILVAHVGRSRPQIIGTLKDAKKLKQRMEISAQTTM